MEEDKEQQREKRLSRMERMERLRPVRVSLRMLRPVQGTLERTASRRAEALGLGVRVGNRDLKEELANLWARPFEHLPVYKDLPRLAMRTTVDVRKKDFRDFITEEDNIKLNGGTDSLRRQSSLSAWERRLNNKDDTGYKSVRDHGGFGPREKGKEKEGGGDDEDFEEVYFAEETTWYISVSVNLPQGLEEKKRGAKWQNMNIKGLVSLVYNEAKGSCKIFIYDQDAERMIAEKVDANRLINCVDSTRYFILEIPEKRFKRETSVGFAFYTREDSAAFLQFVQDYRTPKNMRRPRMHPRISGFVDDEDEVTVPLDTRTQRMQVFESLVSLVLGIARELEPRDTQESIAVCFDRYRKSGKAATIDMAILTQDVIEKSLGKQTRTAKVLKVINQNMIFCGAYEIKTKITKHLMTKDVRTADGWTVSVVIAPNVIVITHNKKEMSILTPTTKDGQFEFEWKLSAVFNKSMTKMEAVWLRITNLCFSPETSEENKEMLNQVFCNGQLHVY